MPNRVRWSSVEIRIGDRVLAGDERLAGLVRWLRGEAPAGARFVDLASGEVLATPANVNWNQFPLQEAMDAAERWDGAR